MNEDRQGPRRRANVGPQNPLSNSHDGAHTPLVSKLASVAYADATAARLEKRCRMGSHNLTAM